MTTRFLTKLVSLLTGGTQHLRFSMVGPSGVGKTSLVTSMCDRMQDLIERTDLALTCRPEDSTELVKTRLSLQGLFARPETLWVDPSFGVPPTTDPRDFCFWLGRSARRSELMLQFCDFPGEWMSRNATAEEWNYVADLVCGSIASIVPIDTPALMQSAAWHRERNLPDLVSQLIQTAYANLKSPRLVVFVPLRCENYMTDSTRRAQMVAKIQEGYRDLMEYLAQRRGLVTVVVAPVQTLGQIEFVDSADPRSYQPRFAKCSADAEYEPRDGEQPLRYLMRFVMRFHQDSREVGISGMIRRLFGSDEPLVRAVREFAAGCKNGDGFAVLQGAEWLDMRSVVR